MKRDSWSMEMKVREVARRLLLSRYRRHRMRPSSLPLFALRR